MTRAAMMRHGNMQGTPQPRRSSTSTQAPPTSTAGARGGLVAGRGMAPVILLFLAAQNAFVEGVTLTGVKG
jgi:ABC-type glycerol-3-phosphate transport system permease component